MTEVEKASRMALEALTYLVEHDSYGTEYDGRIIHLCPSCSKQDGEHSQKCDFVKARQVITALTQALATTEPDFDGSVIVGHSKHRGGWFVFEEVAEGEFTPIKGPFSSKDEADQAMRAPRAPLIQPAPTERNLIPTPDHNGAVVPGAHVPASPADMQVYNKIAAGYWTERKGPLSKDQIREVFLAHGFTIKEGQTDLKPYVYDAANALIALVQPATERKREPGLFATEVQPQPLRYSLDDYHRAPSEGPLNATWQDKPHRLLYDLVAALAYYTSPQVPEDVIVILDECRTALIECDRDCDYELIDRAYAAIDAARKGE